MNQRRRSGKRDENAAEGPAQEPSADAPDDDRDAALSIASEDLVAEIFGSTPANPRNENNRIPFPAIPVEAEDSERVEDAAQDSDAGPLGDAREEPVGQELSNVDLHIRQKEDVVSIRDMMTNNSDLVDRLGKLIGLVGEKIAAEPKASVGDWIKLIELQRELMKTSGRRQVHVTWITPTESDVEKIFGPRKRGPKGGLDAA